MTGPFDPDESEFDYGSSDVPADTPPLVDESLRYAAPEIALGHDLGQAAAYGSPKARRRAKVIAWVVIASMVLPILLAVFYN